MNCLRRLPLVFPLLMLGVQGASASTAYGDLNNFDTVNDTGQDCHGFEIEIEDIHSTDITYTYDWNHYGPPKIREDNTDLAHPRVFIRYESAKNPDGTWANYTAMPSGLITPTDGHSCTNPSVNQGCEHFGVWPDIIAFGKKTQICGIMAGPRLDEVDGVFKVSSRINSTFGGRRANWE